MRTLLIACVLLISTTVRADPPLTRDALMKAMPVMNRRVVLVSVDGWRTDLVSDMPFARRLMREGSSTLMAETPLPSVTVVSHAAMLTGATPEHNGVTHDGPDKDVEWTWRPLKRPTIFRVLDEQLWRTGAAFFQKAKFSGLLPLDDVHGPKQFSPDLEPTLKAACADLSERPANDRSPDAFVFIHLRDIDAAGHEYGWMSKEQKRAAVGIDHALRTIYDCVKKGDRAGHLDTTLIVTADHGGHAKTHGTGDATDRLVPWIAVGKPVRKHWLIRGQVRLIDTAPTTLRLISPHFLDVMKSADGQVIEEIFATH